MQFDIITIFPHMFDSYFSESIIARAQKEKFIQIRIHNLRDYSLDKHKRVDDTSYGGGAGMVMKVAPLYRALKTIKEEKKKTRIILFSAKGQKYNQAKARKLVQYDNLIFVCGRYEGVDERVAEHLIDEEISTGDYILTGGEIPAMTVLDSVARLIPGVLGNPESLKEESFNDNKVSKLEYPQYTKPEEFNNWKVPAVLLSGNHHKIKEWREKKKTK